MKWKEKQIAELSVDSKTWKRVLKWEGESVLTYSIRCPDFPEDLACFRRIGRYYHRIFELWKNRWENVLYQRACTCVAAAREQSLPFRPWEASLNYTVTFQQENLLSLYLDAWEYSGGVHGVTVRRGDTWELSSGTPRCLSSFFPPHSRWRRSVLEALHAQASERISTGETLYFEDWPDRISSCFDPDRFYLTEQGIALFYPLYTIAPYAEGIPVFSMPYH